MLEIKKLKEENFADWNDFIKNHFASLYGLKTSWKIFLEETFNYNACYFYFLEDKNIIGILPLFEIKSRLVGRKFVSVPFCDCGGIYFAKDVSDEKKLQAWNLAENSTKKLPFDFRGVAKTSTTFLEQNKDFKTYAPYVQMQIDLTKSLQEIEKNFSDNIIRNLKDTDEISVKISDIFDNNLYDFYVKEMKKFGSPPLNFSFFTNQKKYLKENLLIFTAFYKDCTIGALTCISAGDTLYADLIMSDDKLAKKHPKHKLYYSALKYAKTNNFKIFNLSRTRKNSGVYEHKRRWGANEKHIYCMQSPSGKDLFIDADNKKAKIVSAIFKLLPSLILKKIGPILRKHLAK